MSSVRTDWWRDFFRDVTVEMWLQAVPEEYTRTEAAYIEKMLQAPPGAKVLDVPCGGGRHTLALAAAGYRMTGVDFSEDFLREARKLAAVKKLDVTWLQQDMRKLDWEGEFAGAFCFGNSFGYDDDEGHAAFLKAVHRSLQPGGRFVLDYPTVLEARLPKFQHQSWARIGDIFFLEEDRYDHERGRTITEYTFIRNGEIVKRPGSHRNYTYREICRMMSDAGFADVQTFGGLADEPFQLGSERLILVGRKK